MGGLLHRKEGETMEVRPWWRGEEGWGPMGAIRVTFPTPRP